MLAVHERRRPRAVHVPQQDVHDAPPSSRTASTTPDGSTVDRHGCPGTGHSVARLCRHSADRVTEADARHPVRRPLSERDRRREQAHHRRADRGRQVRRPGVADDQAVGARDDRGERGHRGAPAEVDGVVAGDARRQLPFGGSAGDHDPVSGRGQRGHDVAAGLRRAGAGRHRRARGARRRSHRRAARRPPTRAGAQPQRRVVAGRQRESGRRGERERPLGLRDAQRHPVPHVEQRARVVVADRADPRHPGHPQHERERQRGLVEGGEDDRLVGADGGEPGGQPLDVRGGGPVRRRVDPGQPPLDDLVDAGQQLGGGPAARPAQQRDGVGAGPHGADRRAGEQDVAGRVRADDQDAARAPVPSTRRAGPDEPLPPQDEVHGAAQVAGHGRSGRHLLGRG